MPKIKFFDVKAKKSFTSDRFKLVRKLNKKRVTYFAVADAPSGIKAWRIVSKDFYMKYK